MFPFKKPPSRAEVARETVVNAVSGALDSLSHHAHDLLENAHDLVEHTLESAHGKLETVGEKIENSPLDKAKTAAGAVTAGGVATVVGAAEKVGKSIAAAREPNDNDKTPTDAARDLKRARKQAQSEIKTMNKQALKYKSDLEHELARDQKLFAAEQERLQREHDQLQADLEDARQQAADERAALAKSRREYDDKNDITRVPIAPTDEVVAFDDDGDGDYEYGDFEYRDADNRKGGGNTWLILGGVLLASAGAVYYLFSSTGGRRKRAAIQDRVGKVAEGVREKVTQNSDETGETEAVVEAASDAFDSSNEKTADATLPDKAVDKIEEVSDKVADGIAGAGAFLADKLEAAGASAKSAAHSAAEKIDDARDKTVAKIDQVRKPAPTQAPNAVVVEVITDERPKGETTEEILAEVEETVRNIENSVREEK